MTDQRVKLQKIKDLTNILKDTDRNLTICEEILSAFMEKRLQQKTEAIQRRTDLEAKMTEILDNLKTRLLMVDN
ncbi:uncharacterized protein LOC105685139 [Athalia rosae]|uniref:uncharacterized protein LOC105685139 n=1 Tax=Athalia rosae TaxID=37344 RepID=UPI0020347FBA|nr:uncharacterized protein LOC105685139 [Athalia rosae]